MIATLLTIAACHVGGHAPFVTPSNICTPGSYVRLTRAQACVSKNRPDLPAADRRWIVTRYGVPNWSGTAGELDHRQPFWSGGRTDRSNVWPEPGAIPNAKDRLETYTRNRVCLGKPHPMRLQTVHRIFAGNWVAYYRFYGLGQS